MTQEPPPNIFRLPDVLGLIGAPNITLLTVWELYRYQQGWRTVAALLISALATLLPWLLTMFTAL